MQRNSVAYTLFFAAIVCLVCAIPIAASAVLLRPKQAQNQRVDRLKRVLEVAGLMAPGERLGAEEVEERFQKHLVAIAVDLRSDSVSEEVDPTTFDQRRAARDDQTSEPAPPNEARVIRVPHHAVIYEVKREEGGPVDGLVLPIQGYGLWSTMYGYVALEADAQTVAGITFYEHGETPGLGGEIENPSWQARWPGRQVYGPNGEVKLAVAKGQAGEPAEDPFRVDGLSGATITSRGVSNTISFWLGPNGFGPYLKRYRQEARR